MIDLTSAMIHSFQLEENYLQKYFGNDIYTE